MCNDESIQELLKQVFHLYVCRAMYLRDEYDAHPKGGGTLYFLDKKDGVSQKELADMMRVKPPSITAALKKVEGMGYVRKEQDPADHRVTRLYITEKGRKEAGKMKAVIKQLKNEGLEDITPEEQMLLRRLLLQMKGNLSAKEGKEHPPYHPGLHK